MTDPAPNTPPAEGATPPADGSTPPAPDPPAPTVTVEDVARLQAALDKERNLHKTVKQQLAEFQKTQRSSMDETERNLLEARESAAAEVRKEYGSRLAQTEFRAAAASRNPEFDVAKALKYVDLAGFIGDDGEPDAKAIAAAVADLIPEGSAGPPVPPSFDGGPRGTPQTGVSMSQLIRQAAGRA